MSNFYSIIFRNKLLFYTYIGEMEVAGEDTDD